MSQSICLQKFPLLRPTSRMASGAAQLQSEVHVSAHPMTVISAFSQTYSFSCSGLLVIRFAVKDSRYVKRS